MHIQMCTYIHIHSPNMHIKYLAYIPNLVGIFVSGRYLAIKGRLQLLAF